MSLQQLLNEPTAVPSAELRAQKEKEEQAKLKARVEKRKLDFRLYLQQSGVIDKLSKVLVRMYEEPTLPDDPIKYFKNLLVPEGLDAEIEELDQLAEETNRLKSEITCLTEENKRLRAALGIPADGAAPSISKPPERDPNQAVQQKESGAPSNPAASEANKKKPDASEKKK